VCCVILSYMYIYLNIIHQYTTSKTCPFHIRNWNLTYTTYFSAQHYVLISVISSVNHVFRTTHIISAAKLRKQYKTFTVPVLARNSCSWVSVFGTYYKAILPTARYLCSWHELDHNKEMSCVRGSDY
jgi:hypothetical protein